MDSKSISEPRRELRSQCPTHFNLPFPPGYSETAVIRLPRAPSSKRLPPSPYQYASQIELSSEVDVKINLIPPSLNQSGSEHERTLGPRSCLGEAKLRLTPHRMFPRTLTRPRITIPDKSRKDDTRADILLVQTRRGMREVDSEPPQARGPARMDREGESNVLGMSTAMAWAALEARACTPVSMVGGKDRFVAQGFRGRQRRNERKTVWGRERAGRIECPVRVALAHATHWVTSVRRERSDMGTSFVVSSAPEPLGAQSLPVGPDTRYRSERKTPREDDTLRTIGRAWRRIAIGVWGLGGAPPVTIDEADVVMRGAAQKRRSMRSDESFERASATICEETVEVHAKWMVAARDLSDDEDSEELQWLATTMGLSTAKFLPCMLCPLEVALHPFIRETLLMELLAAEHSDEELDYGEPEVSGNDYDN
ncbi:hypothetical protein B0H13DRAFT_1897889 [Mycena leptocephala]|nr:hypothetical protein B0H13DRAFT_1897889 [Mycena leptocephala]